MSLKLPTVRVAAIACVASTALLAPAAAHAAPYEQIDRANGANGGSPLWGWTTKGTAVGDVGRYVGWERERWNEPVNAPVTEGYVRDIVSNTNVNYGGGVLRVYSIDRAEKRALILRTRSGQQQVVAVPIAGGTPIIVAQTPISSRAPEAALSGNGKKVVVSTQNSGTKIYDLTGGIAALSANLGSTFLDGIRSRAVSDTGSAVVASGSDVGFAIFRPGKAPVKLGGSVLSAVIDPAGSTVAFIEKDNTVVRRNVASGAEQRWPSPREYESLTAIWTSAGGSKIAVSATPDFDNVGAQVLTTGVGSAGTWAPFGDRFRSFIVGGVETPISANGRFAGIGRSSVVLANLNGAHIVGANEGLSAKAYVYGASYIETCDVPAKFTAAFLAPKFAPAPKKATLTARVDGQVIASGTLTNPVPYPPLGFIPDLPESRITGEYIAEGHGDVQLTASVTDGAGRVLSETWTEPLDYCRG